MKPCACTRVISRTSWASLPLVGATNEGVDRGERLELRTCACGTTLCKPVRAADSLPPLSPADSKIGIVVANCGVPAKADLSALSRTCSYCGEASPDTDTTYALFGVPEPFARASNGAMRSVWRCFPCSCIERGSAKGLAPADDPPARSNDER